MPTRRDLLKTTAVAAASCILPKNPLATPSSNFHFIHTDTLYSKPVADPVSWTLQNANEPILARASDGLDKLTHNDTDRIIQLILRRCSLNLLEVHGNRLQIHDRGRQGMTDLRPFFKQHGLARSEIRFELRDRKNETVTTLTGDSFLYGVPIASDFPLELFHEKWEQRFVNEPDDSQAAPGTASGFAWDGIEDGLIPWAALKSAWRRGASGVCLDCSGETLLVNFGLRQVGLFNRASCFEYVCGTCRRSFPDESVEDVPGWMAMNLDEVVRPDAEMVWGKRLNLEGNA